MTTMKKLKRMLALLLCVTMLTGTMLPAYAEGGDGQDQQVEETGETETGGDDETERQFGGIGDQTETAERTALRFDDSKTAKALQRLR